MVLFGLVYAWLLYTVALALSQRFRRFSLRALLIAFTAASLLMGAAAVWLGR
jgi:hypothetical protein